MKKIKVPEGMLEAAHKASEFTNYEREKRTLRFSLGIINTILEASLLWLTEHPIVPTESQAEDMIMESSQEWRVPFGSSDPNAKPSPKFFLRQDAISVCTKWQRRMFDAPELEVPEEIRELLNLAGENGGPTREEFHSCVLEAYRRGKRSQKS